MGNKPRHYGKKYITVDMVMDLVDEIMRPVLTKLGNNEQPTEDEWTRYFSAGFPLIGGIGDKMFEKFFPKE